MTSNGYRPPYRQGHPPPLQQQYRQNQHDQGNYHGGQPGRSYNQPDQINNNFPTGQDCRGYEEQYPSDERWGSEHYQEPYYQAEHQQESQRYDSDLRQQRNYQYDDRYRINAQARPPMQGGQSRTGVQGGQGRPPPQMNQFTRMASQGDMRQPTVRDRILKEPESPKNASWDNPFPTFPSKRKPVETRRIEPQQQPKTDTPDSRHSQDYQQPLTSHNNQRTGPSRPHTSHSQRHIEPIYEFSDHSDMPSRKDAPFSSAQPAPYQQSPIEHTSARPLPRRAMTGPTPKQPEYGYEQDPYQSEREYLPQEFAYGNHTPQNHQDEHMQQHQPANNEMPASMPYNRNASGHQRRLSDHRYRDHQWKNSEEPDSALYRGVPIANNGPANRPNLDTTPHDVNEKSEHQPGSLRQRPSQFQAYRKPTYQEGNAPQLDRQQQSPVSGNDLASPLAQFTFELAGSQPPIQPSEVSRPSDEPGQIYGGENVSSPFEQIQQSPYPVRSPSQHNDSALNSNQGYPTGRTQNYQSVKPFRPGLAQLSSNNQSDFAHADNVHSDGRYETRYMQDTSHERQAMPPFQTSYQSDVQRQGYDTRLQPRTGYATTPSSRSYPQQGPPRPATAGPGIPTPAHDYSSRTSSDSYQRSHMQNPDSLPAHPAPFRPGLMQSAPPPPPPPPPQPMPLQQTRPIQHGRVPSGSKSSLEIEPPVTIRELNMLRDDARNHPDDHALGLRFAKRLVEAAKVLASENGRADPKQTAKNRERYIFDAHKAVKKLCAAGYPDAMFYLADCYGQGLLGLAPDSKEAFALYQSAAKLGHAQAAYRVAVCCELGSEEGGGTRRDPLKAVHWYKRAASLGDTPAMYKMGMIQLKGLLSQPRSPREAISWLKRAAERADKENPHALHELGLLYENAQPSDVIIRDDKYALQLFSEAADLGYKYSQFRLGSVYEYGLLGLPIDPRMSIAWYSRAAKQGEHQAEFALSGWYLTGSGQPPPGEPMLLAQSDTEAYLWARKAASSGLAKAEYAMGYYTEVGIGTTPNIEEAKRWYYRAAAQNHPKARERLEDLKRGGQRMQKTRVSRSNVGKHNEGECTVM